jgi:hypothetical protein
MGLGVARANGATRVAQAGTATVIKAEGIQSAIAGASPKVRLASPTFRRHRRFFYL